MWTKIHTIMRFSTAGRRVFSRPDVIDSPEFKSLRRFLHWKNYSRKSTLINFHE
jgi:hypothetical protein